MENFKRNLVKETLSAPSMLKQVGLWLVEKANSTLSDFATFVCEKCGFTDDSGKPQKVTCVTALKKLDEQGLISLQENLNNTPRHNKTHQPVCLDEHVPSPVDVPERVDEIADLRLEKVSTPESKKVLYTLLRDEHYLGNALPPGRRISYLVKSKHGLLGAVCFSAAANRLEARDTWVGWTEDERKQNLDCILNMSRLLIRKDVHCKNLATKVISMSLGAVQHDCLEQYKFSPYLIETFVDTEKFEGTCYKAAGWQEVGLTKGRGWDDRFNNAWLSKKKIFIAVLVPDFRERLNLQCCTLPTHAQKVPEWVTLGALQVTDGLGVSKWAALEFGLSNLGHKDRNARLVYSAEKIALHPHFSPNAAFYGDTAGAKGWYRFIETSCKQVNFESILSGPVACTCRRMMNEAVVLLWQDQTKMNFTSKPGTKGTGPIGCNQTEAVSLGFLLQTSLAATTYGLPLGPLKATCTVREEKTDEEKSKKRAAEEKESYIWNLHAQFANEVAAYMPDTQVIEICDRGADIGLFIYDCYEMNLISRGRN